MNKLITLEQVGDYIQDDMCIMVGGFGNVGNPKTIIDAIADSGVKHLTVVANDLGTPNAGLGRWVRNNMIRKAIGSYFTYNPEVAQLYRKKAIDIQMMPQGTFAEAIRAGGSGIGGFYTTVGIDTQITDTWERQVIDGQEMLFVRPLIADVAIIYAKTADTMGNLVYECTARNFNPIMAMAAKFTIVEVEEIVPAGSLSPEAIITPFVFVDKMILTKGRQHN